VSVLGEISDLSRAASGHVYFTLRDPNSQIGCALFRREATQQLDAVHDLRKGLLVVVHGFLTLYEPRGSFQIYVQRVVPQGEGGLALRIQQLKSKLEAEGLFEAGRKRRLPPFPRKLALITSPGGQAYHDVLHRLRVQYPFVRVVEVGVSVQGDGAADEMAMAIDIVNRLTDVEVILLVRGGGAPEDLYAFDEERLARAIFASRIPVVTGIGHETDTSIADLVADLRAATPSLAAAAAVPDLGAVMAQMRQLHRQATQTVAARVRANRRHWVEANRALLRSNPETRIHQQRRRQREIQTSMRRQIEAHLRAKRVRLDALSSQLRALDPLAILNRGYAVLQDAETGALIRSATSAAPGALLRARVADGEFLTRVEAS
jgi:exodeoxyribonuclease VII large subunit